MEQEQQMKELEKLKRKVKKLEKTKNKKAKVRSKRLLTKIGDFQENLGRSVAPIRKIFSYITAFIFFVAGLVLLIMGTSDKDTDEASYYFIIGGFLLVASILMLVYAYYWYKIVGESSTAAKIEGFSFEAGLISGLLGK